jgi:hypothetical protein
MLYRIKRVSVAQLVKMLTALYACLGVIFLPVFLIASLADPELRGLGATFALFFPLLYAVIGALSGAVGAALYNWIAKGLGGVEVELGESASTVNAREQEPNFD